MFEHRILSNVRLVALCFVIFAAMLAHGQDEIPVLRTTPGQSTVKFNVKASVQLVGTFEKWHATLVFASTDISTGVLDVKIDADSVHTGSGMKDDKLKGKDFLDVKDNPLITFHSDKIVQTGPNTFDLPGTFTVRGVSKPETLTFIFTGTKGSGSGDVRGTMAFDRKDYGMNKGILFVTVANRVEVTLDFKVKRVSGPPLVFKQ